LASISSATSPVSSLTAGPTNLAEPPGIANYPSGLRGNVAPLDQAPAAAASVIVLAG